MHEVKDYVIFNCLVCTRDTWPSELEYKNLAEATLFLIPSLSTPLGK